MEDPEVFLFGNDVQAGLVSTLDEHDAANPIKPLPDRPHLRALTKLWVPTQQLVVAKSRQMMASWLSMALILWEVYHPGRKWGVACRLFDPADALLERMWGIHERIPRSLRPAATRKQGSITVKHDAADSLVLAFAEDSDAPRSMTLSGLLVDEAAFTDSLESLYGAAKPTTMSGGKLVLISSPSGRNLFYNLLTDNDRITL
jgi:hypothetical protein